MIVSAPERSVGNLSTEWIGAPTRFRSSSALTVSGCSLASMRRLAISGRFPRCPVICQDVLYTYSHGVHCSVGVSTRDRSRSCVCLRMVMRHINRYRVVCPRTLVINLVLLHTFVPLDIQYSIPHICETQANSSRHVVHVEIFLILSHITKVQFR